MIYLEFIWLDGNNPQQLRSKTKIINKAPNLFNINQIKGNLLSKMSDELISDWNFDGSSVKMAPVNNSELILRPCNIFKDPLRQDSLLILCEVFNIDGTPHKTNTRAKLRDVLKYDQHIWIGMELEYFIFDKKTDKPLGWITDSSGKINPPKSQGDFYCGVGSENIVCRDFVEEHTKLCVTSGINISGINLEVGLSQCEYQVGPVTSLDGADQLWMSRYILFRLSEKYGYKIVLDPKPFNGTEISGSGMHFNFSTKSMREDLVNKKKIVIEACEKLSKRVKQHISVYGKNNENRLTGHNETCAIDEFRYGVGDRTASIRIPSSINDTKTPGYLEDRRPASNCDPYEVCKVLIETICSPVNELV